jgi:hypothetical protein
MPVYIGICFIPPPPCPIPPCAETMITNAGNDYQEIPSHVTIIDEQVKYYESEKMKGLEPSVYPNPTDGSITVLLNKNAEQDNKITISDLIGRELLKMNVNKGDAQAIIDMSDLPTGLYLVSIFSNEGKLTTLKLVKE